MQKPLSDKTFVKRLDTLLSRTMGKWLSRYEGRIVNGRKAIKVGVSHQAALWRIITVE